MMWMHMCHRMIEVDPEEKHIHRKFYIFDKINYKFVQFMNFGPASCVSVTESSKGLQGILYSLPGTRPQWSPCPIRVWILKIHVCSHSKTYTQQCTFKRESTTKALVANTQLLYLNCFRIETHN